MTTAPPESPAKRPFGAWPQAGASVFRIWSECAQRIDLCLRGSDGAEHRLPMEERGDGVFECHAAGVGPGQRYGYRAHGPGLAATRVLDPYARSIDPDPHARVPWGVVAAPLPALRWPRPRRPWQDTVLLECGVRAATIRHPRVPEPWRGRFAGLASPPMLAYLRDLGVTAVELLPVQAWRDEPFLAAHGLRNLWGYNPIAMFAPMPRLAAGTEPLAEFQAMVEALHAAGIEVILDVVFNHSGEGEAGGLAISQRGLDPKAWYRRGRDPENDDPGWTGTGNALDLSHPRVRGWMLDALDWWANGLGVDGFRFDLASTLARDAGGHPDPAGLLALIGSDPRLAGLKWIVEPWDLGPQGYQAGRYAPAAEWNDHFRDDVRRYWGGLARSPADLATRLAGSSDRYAEGGSPLRSINYLAAHDGLPLADVPRYSRRHNLANAEHNRDGHAGEVCWSDGHEGPSEDPLLEARRDGLQRAMLATLFLAQGVPMLALGDERGRSQYGNNNAWCQDNPIGWLDWLDDARTRGLQDWVRRLVALRRDEPRLRRQRFFPQAADCAHSKVQWRRPDGALFSPIDWRAPADPALMMLLPGPDSVLVLLLNPDAQPRSFSLPPDLRGGQASLRLSSAEPWVPERILGPIQGLEVAAHAMVLLEWRAGT